jgi:hypothetical protein
MPDATPLATVVIVCRDGGFHLEDSVDSVFAQTLAEAQILVVDDGSADASTRRLLAGYDWPRTSVVRQQRPHAAAARNLALGLVRTPYLCCLEAGDLLAPGYLEEAVQELEGAPDVPFAVAWAASLGALQVERCPPDAGPAGVLSGLVPPCAVLRRAAVEAAGGYRVTLADGGADEELLLRLALARPGIVLPRRLLQLRAAPALAALAPGELPGVAPLLPQIVDLQRRHLVALWSAVPTSASTPPVSPPELATLGNRVLELERALEHDRAHIVGLHRSLSWRLTAPLRAVHRWLLGRGSGREGPAGRGGTLLLALVPLAWLAAGLSHVVEEVAHPAAASLLDVVPEPERAARLLRACREQLGPDTVLAITGGDVLGLFLSYRMAYERYPWHVTQVPPGQGLDDVLTQLADTGRRPTHLLALDRRDPAPVTGRVLAEPHPGDTLLEIRPR